MSKFKLIKASVSAVLISATLSGCKTMDCDIVGNHVHFYENENTQVVRLIEGEKESKKGYNWTYNHIMLDDEVETICENDLCYVSQNLDYLEDKINKCVPYREVYQYAYRYGTYYGYGYGYHYTASGKYEYGYGYGLQTGYHYEYGWDRISMDEFTNDQVRDITYKYRLYKIDNNGEIVPMIFENIEDAPSEYRYFKTNDFVVKNVSNPYYLNEYTK